MQLKTVVPALPVLTELGNTFSDFVSVSPNGLTDRQHGVVGKSAAAHCRSNELRNQAIRGSS